MKNTSIIKPLSRHHSHDNLFSCRFPVGSPNNTTPRINLIMFQNNSTLGHPVNGLGSRKFYEVFGFLLDRLQQTLTFFKQIPYLFCIPGHFYSRSCKQNLYLNQGYRSGCYGPIQIQPSFRIRIQFQPEHPVQKFL